MNLCHLVAFNHFMIKNDGLRHGLNRGINREWHKMPTLTVNHVKSQSGPMPILLAKRVYIVYNLCSFKVFTESCDNV